MELMWNGLRSFQTETKEVGFGDMISSIQETRIVFDTVKCVTFVTNYRHHGSTRPFYRMSTPFVYKNYINEIVEVRRVRMLETLQRAGDRWEPGAVPYTEWAYERYAEQLFSVGNPVPPLQG